MRIINIIITITIISKHGPHLSRLLLAYNLNVPTEERDASSKCRPIASGSHLQNNSISIRQGENRNCNARKLTIGSENLKYVCS
jgi:hypothetical protein